MERPVAGTRIEQEQMKQLDRLAEAQGVKRGDLLRQAIETWLEAQEHTDQRASA